MFKIKRRNQYSKISPSPINFYLNEIHKVQLDELCLHLQLGNIHDGLTNAQVKQAQNKYGLNRLCPEVQPSYFRIFISETFTGFNALLWIAAFFAFLTYRPLGNPNPDPANLSLAIILSFVTVVNGILSFYQRIKSMKVIGSFSKVMPKITTVRRNLGQEQLIATEQLVPGDVVILKAGDKIPADCRVISAVNLRLNNAELSGESKPVKCCTMPTSENYLSSKNMIFCSASVIDGCGTALVVATGEQTVIDRISQLMRVSTADDLTGLHRQVNRFLLFVLTATIIFIATVWMTWAAWLNPKFPAYIELHANIINSIGMIVGFLPVGLPSAVTLILLIIAKKMLSQNVLVTSLQTLEKFNSVSVICTDKTGTLTENKMKCTHLLWDTNEEYQPSVHGKARPQANERKSLINTFVQRISNTQLRRFKSMTNMIDVDDVRPMKKFQLNQIYMKGRPQRDLVLGACLCNSAEKRLPENGKILEISGDAEDVALYDLCENGFNVDVELIRKSYLRIHCLPFNSNNKFMIVANELSSNHENSSILDNRSNEILLTMKGAADILLTSEKCSSYKTNSGEIKPLTDTIRLQIIRRQERMGKNSYRVIAMLQRKINRESFEKILAESNPDDLYNGFPTDGYTFIGLFCLMDPPRFGVYDAVQRARQAHIRIAMITGDHPTTAVSLAKHVDILSSKIIQDQGFDSFQLIGIDTPTGRPVIQLLRNGQALDTHILGSVSSFNETAKYTSRIQLTNDDDTVKLSMLKRFYARIRYYFTEPEVPVQYQKRSQIIPYAMIIKGSDISYMDDFIWNWVLAHEELIFARISPEQKLRIVIELQKRAETVAVTGDGTNDAPALKRSDLGVAMESSSDVSKDACDLVLMDNNFISIVNAIETGRLLHDNLKKVSIYLLPGGSWSQIWPVFLHIWLGVPSALSAFLATVFCMLNDVLMSLAMAMEKPEKNIMHRLPATKNQCYLFDRKLLFHAYMIIGNIECFSSFFCFFWWYHSNGIPLSKMFFKYDRFQQQFSPDRQNELNRINETGQCIYYVALCIMQFFNLLTTRSRYASFFTYNPFWSRSSRNLWSIIAIMMSILICISVTEIPFIQKYFKTHHVPIMYVLPAFAFGFLMFILDELRKFYIRRNPGCFFERIAW